MKKILIYSPDPLDGVSFFRQWGPLSAMKHEYDVKQFGNRMEELTHWTWYLNTDVAMISRPHRPFDLAFLETCKKWGVKTWLDYDDDLLSITPDNPVFETFANDTARKVIEETLKGVDVISTSSPKLAVDLTKYNPNVRLIRNGQDDRLLKFQKPFGKRDRVSYRGSVSHQMDLIAFSVAIEKGLGKLGKGQVLFAGLNPYMVKRPKDAEFLYAKPQNLIDFIHAFTEWNAAVQFVPLILNEFNRAKSNIAWLDATLAGSACVCPWEDPGALTYAMGNADNFEFRLRQALSSTDGFLEIKWKESKEYIRENLLLSTLNKLRKELIENL